MSFANLPDIHPQFFDTAYAILGRQNYPDKQFARNFILKRAIILFLRAKGYKPEQIAIAAQCSLTSVYINSYKIIGKKKNINTVIQELTHYLYKINLQPQNPIPLENIDDTYRYVAMKNIHHFAEKIQIPIQHNLNALKRQRLKNNWNIAIQQTYIPIAAQTCALFQIYLQAGYNLQEIAYLIPVHFNVLITKMKSIYKNVDNQQIQENVKSIQKKINAAFL
jgi:hypothetical protein